MGLVLFVFLLVWAAGLVPKLGERLGQWWGDKNGGSGGT